MQLFDEKELLERVDNDWDFLADTVQMLEADGRALMAEIRRAADAGDAPALGRAGHTIKGMISNFCSPATHASALEVETIGKCGEAAAAPAAVKILEARLETLIAGLKELLAARSRCAS
jgi:HPt (histidine-containing phosphotransfer) domain-containing protein